MTNSKFSFIIFVIVLFIFSSCNQNSNKTVCTESIVKTNQIDTKAEIDRWKKELISNKKIGNPCTYKNFEEPDVEKWSKENPQQMDGLPSDDKEIKSVYADFDGDGKQDLLLFFRSNNCIGHNGGTPLFAKIIYADRSSNSNIMDEIYTSIIKEYNKQRTIDKNLKAITNNYLMETTTIEYTDKITGRFKLYTKDDAHCCPSYDGKYYYNPKEKSIEIQISEIKK